VSDHLALGDEVDVKLVSMDSQGKLDLSRKALLPVPDDLPPQPPRPPRGERPHSQSGSGGGQHSDGGHRRRPKEGG